LSGKHYNTGKDFIDHGPPQGPPCRSALGGAERDPMSALDRGLQKGGMTWISSRWATPLAIVALGVALAGCDRDSAPPAQQATQALGSARDDIAKAKTSIDAIEKQSGELNEKIKSQRAELNALIEKRLVLLRQQLKEDEERIRRLPAAQETELRPRLAELAQQLEDVTAKLNAYRDAPPEKSGPMLAALEKSLATFSEARRDLEAKLQSA
jgi:septal ring factor EnvC (AmiA/AmiB activator)